jgi:uncharacterized protein YfdQ (DUF2303 family)
MTTTQTLTTEAEVIATLAERAAELQSYPLAADTSVVVTRIGDNENVDVTDLEAQLNAPRRPRGQAILHHPADFAAYVNKLANESATTVWADADRGSVVAVLNDHASDTDAGWRDHTVTLSLHSDSDWNVWANTDAYMMTQQEFAEHIEKTRHAIVEPDAATLLEIVTNFSAKRNIVFRSNVRLASGDVSLTYDEQTAAHSGPGNIEVPSEFKLMLSPFSGMPPQPLAARLRFRIESGCLRIGYNLVRPDLLRRNAFEAALKEVGENLDTDQIFRGTAPAALNRSSGSGW